MEFGPSGTSSFVWLETVRLSTVPLSVPHLPPRSPNTSLKCSFLWAWMDQGCYWFRGRHFWTPHIESFTWFPPRSCCCVYAAALGHVCLVSMNGTRGAWCFWLVSMTLTLGRHEFVKSFTWRVLFLGQTHNKFQPLQFANCVVSFCYFVLNSVNRSALLYSGNWSC